MWEPEAEPSPLRVLSLTSSQATCTALDLAPTFKAPPELEDRLRVVKGDFLDPKLPLPPATVDFIYLGLVSHLIEPRNWPALINTVARLLPIGGTAFFRICRVGIMVRFRLGDSSLTKTRDIRPIQRRDIPVFRAESKEKQALIAKYPHAAPAVLDLGSKFPPVVFDTPHQAIEALFAHHKSKVSQTFSVYGESISTVTTKPNLQDNCRRNRRASTRKRILRFPASRLSRLNHLYLLIRKEAQLTKPAAPEPDGEALPL